MYVFTTPWWLFLAGLLGLGVVLYAIGRRFGEADTRRRFLLWVALANWLLFAAYMIGLATTGRFASYIVWDMPLQLCSLITYGLVIALATKSRLSQVLLEFCFYAGSLTGFLALFSPAQGVEGVGVFSPLTFGYFGSHGTNMVISVLIAAFGLYRPTNRGALRAMGSLLVLAAAIIALNLAVRALVLPEANYFYLFDPEGAEILQLLHNAIGLPIVYLVPLLPFALGCFCLQAAMFRGGVRLSRLWGGDPWHTPAAA
jgi:uncharacterized membrane protein YwaF